MTIHDVPRLATVGEIARRLNTTRDRVSYITQSRGIHPSAVAGNALVYSDEAVARIRHELNVLDAVKSDWPSKGGRIGGAS